MFGRVLLVVASSLVIGAKPWSHQARNPFELPPAPQTFHAITECMHVVSEEGNYSFKRSAPPATDRTFVSAADTPVCGLYVVGNADAVVEISIKYMHVSCESGGLLAFVDGWELNGQYFPSLLDHQLPIEQRVAEFCSSDNAHRLFGAADAATATVRRTFRSHQNAALLQYRIPVSGAFIVNVRFVENRKPCHILTESLAPAYVLRNFGERGNCTLTALYPAVVEIKALAVGGNGPFTMADSINFNCDDHHDRLDIGGSAGIDSGDMQVASAACGTTPPTQTPNKEIASNGQAIFCGVTTVRLTSSGRTANQATIALRPAAEADVPLATMLCDM